MNATRRRLALAGVALALAGCATPLPPAPGNGQWSGRLALQVDGQPNQSFSAAFELRGTAQAGELALTSPIGATLGQLSWTTQGATLRAGGRITEYPSVDALLAQLTGTEIPVGALFDWLRGRERAVPGWQADLAQLDAGRLSAVRLDPAPRATLRVVLER